MGTVRLDRSDGDPAFNDFGGGVVMNLHSQLSPGRPEQVVGRVGGTGNQGHADDQQ
jgi:hypothetical protein